MILLVFILFGLAIYFFIRFIVKRDHGHKEPVGALFMAATFGLLALIPAGFLNSILVPDAIFKAIANVSGGGAIPTSTLLISTLGVGLVEESCKSIPLALFIYKKKYFDELTDGIIYFGLAGLAFGITEDISYTMQLGSGVGLQRILMSPYLHSSFCMFFGYALVRVKVLGKPKFWILLGLLASILAHATYDFLALHGGLSSGLGVVVVAGALNVLLFILFRRSQIGDEQRGQSAIGENRFCRHCGKPNPERLLYCSFCGKLS